MQDFTDGDQLIHGAGDLLDRHIRVDAMLVEDIDTVSFQTRKRLVDNGADSLRAAVETNLWTSIPETEFCGDHHLITDRRQSLSDKFLVRVRPIGLGRIEKCHAAV